jgi:hypothetical protein
MPMLQQFWVQTRHPPTQWNLGRCSNVEETILKIKKIPLIRKSTGDTVNRENEAPLIIIIWLFVYLLRSVGGGRLESQLCAGSVTVYAYCAVSYLQMTAQ